MTSPYFILVFAYFLFGDRITKRKILAAVMAFIGCIFIIGLLNGTEHLDVFGLASWGAIAGLAEAILKGDAPAVLQEIGRQDDAGRDLQRLLQESRPRQRMLIQLSCL